MKCNRFFLYSLILFMLASACKKEQEEIGLDLQGENLLGNSFMDTITIEAYSLRQDSINTTKLANNVFGYVTDPIFGKTQAGFYTQFDLSGSNVNFGTAPSLDSVVLTLQYGGYFGDTASALTIRVYELSDALNSSETYYSYSTTPHESENLTYANNFTVTPCPTTPIYLDTVKESAHLRIRLKNSFGINRLLNNPSLTDNNTFQSDFKGLYVVAESASGTGNLIYTNLLSSLSGLTLYYHTDNGAQKYTFSISSTKCTYYNHFQHFDYAGGEPDFRNQVLNGNHALGKEKLYIQGTGGIMTRISFPTLQKTFADKKIVINKAELVITNITEDNAYYFIPAELGLQSVKKDGTFGYLPDDKIYTNSTYFGGTYDSDKKEYRFRITKYVQNEILGLNDWQGINIVASGAGVRGNRLLFCGPKPEMNSSDKRLRLEIYYTTY